MVWASVSGPSSSGSTPPKAAARMRGSADERRRRPRPRACGGRAGPSPRSAVVSVGPSEQLVGPCPHPTHRRARSARPAPPASPRRRPRGGERCRAAGRDRGPDASPRATGRPPPRRCRRGRRSARCARCRNAGRCSARIHVGQASRDGHDLGRDRCRRPARSGGGDDGRRPPRSTPAACGPRCRCRCPRRPGATAGAGAGSATRTAVLMAPVAVEWLADASPKLHTTSASAGQHDRRVQLAGPADGEGHAERPRQVGGDGGGLRDDGQVGVAEHLVAPAGHRVRRTTPACPAARRRPDRGRAPGAALAM